MAARGFHCIIRGIIVVVMVCHVMLSGTSCNSYGFVLGSINRSRCAQAFAGVVGYVRFPWLVAGGFHCIVGGIVVVDLVCHVMLPDISCNRYGFVLRWIKI